MPIIIKNINSIPCEIIERENRFSVRVLIHNKIFKAYNTNTGRLQELLKKGEIGLCSKKTSGKTQYIINGILLSEKTGKTAIINTLLQMKAFEKAIENNQISWLKQCIINKRNPRLGNSVLDYLIECSGEKIYVEIKSAVLRHNDNHAGYPDCISVRGRRHIKELIEARKKNIKTAIIFIAALPEVTAFEPYDKGDPMIRPLLREAKRNKVIIKALQMYGIYRKKNLEIILSNEDLLIIL